MPKISTILSTAFRKRKNRIDERNGTDYNECDYRKEDADDEDGQIKAHQRLRHDEEKGCQATPAESVKAYLPKE